MNTNITIDDGIILRDGAGIGTYNEERNVAWFPKRISMHLYEPIEAAIGRKPEFKVATPEELAAGAALVGESVEDVLASVPMDRGETDPDDAPASSDSDMPEPVAVQADTQSDPPEQVALEAGEPAKDPRMGDKTPAFMAWYLAERGEAAFQARYGHRNCPALPSSPSVTR